MSDAETRMPLADARILADELVALLTPGCVRIEVAGSIRRQRPDIGDIDLVCEPIIEQEVAGLFGDRFTERDGLHDLACRLVEDGVLQKRLNVKGRASWGPHLKRARFHGLNVDLQMVTDASTWGAWMVIRTGPLAFNKALVTPRHQGGALPPGFAWQDGFRLYRGGGRVETPTEASVFEALGMPYLQPEDRAAGSPRDVLA